MAQSHYSKYKLINWTFFVVFCLFAYVQMNDPDPLIWVMVYGIVALLFAVINFVQIPIRFIQVIIFAYLVFASFHITYFYDWLQSGNKSALFGEMTSEYPYMEGTREFMGLLIAILSLIYLQLNSHKIKR